MQTYDIFMLLVLVATTLFGFWKGMAWQVASLASLVLSYFVALRFADQLAPMISDHAPWNKFVAMLIIYIATSFIIWNIFRMVAGMIDRVKLDGFDHQMGALIGFAKGVLLCIAITFFAVSILEGQKETIIASQSGQYIVRLLDKTHSVVPPEIHQVIHPYVERIERQLDPNYQPDHGHNFHTQWPNGSSAWPADSEASDSWPQAPTTGQSPSVYQPSSPPPPPSWPTSEPSGEPAWTPERPQTADRPSGVPFKQGPISRLKTAKKRT